jgi:hypothetical protein
MSFQTSRYKRFLSSGEVFNTAKTLRLIHGLRKADLPTATITGFKRLFSPEVSLPSNRIALARFEKGNLSAALSA